MLVAERPAQDALVDEKNFPVRLRQLRIAAGLNQAQLAELSGIGQGHISQLESGERAPAWVTVLTLANALGVTCEAFRADPGGEPPPPPRAGRPKSPPPTGRRGRESP